MGQYWQLVALAPDKLDKLAAFSGGKLYWFFSSRFPESLVYNLAQPVSETWSFLNCGYSPKVVRQRNELPPILRLPPEILREIFNELDYCSTLQLTLCSTMLWQIGWQCLAQDVQECIQFKNWAGRRMVFLGDYCGAGQHPKGMLTEEEEKKLDGASLYEFAGSCRLRIRDPSFGRRNYAWDWNIRTDGLPSAERKVVEQFIYHPLSIRFVSSETWTLRNITTKEFVRGSELYSAFQEGPCPFGPHIGYPGFGYAILSRICCSPDPSGAIIDGMNHGLWAGHRFEICPQSIHVQTSDTTWTDVSKEMIRDLRVILSQNGVHWGKRKRTTIDGFQEFEEGKVSSDQEELLWS